MRPWLAATAIGLASWNAWLEFAARVTGPATLLPPLLVLAVLVFPGFAARARIGSVALGPLAILLGAQVAAVLFLPPLFRIATAWLAMCACLQAAGEIRAARAPFYGLVLLSLPVLPSLEFYAAYPVRLAAIEASAALLRMNGIAVSVEGLALRFAGELIQFDAPCSGVRMLWTCLFLASALAHVAGFTLWRYARALVLALLFAVAGNVIRATSLFYLESGLIRVHGADWLHDAVGIAAFAITALLLVVALRAATRPEPA